MKSLSWYLARRYMPIQKGEYAISTMAVISFISIAIGSFSLALVTAVMNGFQVSIHEKMQNIHPDATIYSHTDPIAFDALKKALEKEFPQIKAVSPYSISHLMVRSDAMDKNEMPIVSLFKAIDPNAEANVSSLHQKVTKGTLHDISGNEVMIGKSLADTLGVTRGDSVEALYLEQPTGSQKKVTVHQKTVRVGSVFQTGIDEYDSKTIYGSFELFDTLFPDHGIIQVGLSFAPNSNITETIEALQTRTRLDILTWQDLYLPLVSALLLEKYAMFLILLLITIVASMNIIALLFMIITHKRSDIAILRAMGLNHTVITRSFILLGVTISAVACTCGLIAAWGASWFLETYPLITLPDVYYVSHLPARMELSIIVIVFLLVIGISGIASWFSARRIRSINISHVLRFEG